MDNNMENKCRICHKTIIGKSILGLCPNCRSNVWLVIIAILMSLITLLCRLFMHGRTEKHR